MCRCTPEIRTPFCGKIGCEWPEQTDGKVDMVNKPPHYNQGKIEVSDFIVDQKMGFLEGNIVKYVSRYKFKNGVEDLKKARWYLDKLISEQGDGTPKS